MANINNINLGVSPDNKQGNNLREGGQIINDNFRALNLNKLEFDDFYTGNAVVRGGYSNIPNTYSFDVWASIWIIDDIIYRNNLITEILTLDPADALLDRRDVVVIVDDGTFLIKKGTPSLTPIAPEIDLETEVLFFEIDVKAATTAPEGITNNQIYNEYLNEAGGEWDAQERGTPTIVLDSLERSQSGTKSIKFNNSQSRDGVDFTVSNPINGNSFDAIIFRVYIDSSTTITNTRFWLRCYSSSGTNGLAIIINDGQFGFQSNLKDEWQTVIVPVTVLNVNNKFIDEIRLQARQNNVTAYVDNVILQTGIVITSPVINKTSELINDGNGDPGLPFITIDDVPDVSGGNIDGGASNTIFLTEQIFDAGNANN